MLHAHIKTTPNNQNRP